MRSRGLINEQTVITLQFMVGGLFSRVFSIKLVDRNRFLIRVG